MATIVRIIRNMSGTFVHVGDLQKSFEETAVGCDKEMDDEKENPVESSTVIRNLSKNLDQFKA